LAGVTPLNRTPATAPRLLWLSVGIAAGLGASGCSEPRIDKPPAPEMSELIAIYTAPDAVFDPGAASDVALSITLIDELLARTNLRDELVDVLAEVLRQATQLSGGEDGAADVSFEAGGYIRFTRISPVQGADGCAVAAPSSSTSSQS
jgi:hypothetical protein